MARGRRACNIIVMRYRLICAIDRSRCAIGGSLISAAVDRSRNDRSIAQQLTDPCGPLAARSTVRSSPVSVRVAEEMMAA